MFFAVNPPPHRSKLASARQRRRTSRPSPRSRAVAVEDTRGQRRRKRNRVCFVNLFPIFRLVAERIAYFPQCFGTLLASSSASRQGRVPRLEAFAPNLRAKLSH